MPVTRRSLQRRPNSRLLFAPLLVLLLFEGFVALIQAASVPPATSDEAAAALNSNPILGQPDEAQQVVSQGRSELAAPSQRHLSLVKRAPNGFIGMRGKKEYEDGEGGIGGYWNLMPREAASPYNEERTKKSPSASFYGVRGKKYSNDADSQNNNEGDEEGLPAEASISEPARRLRNAAIRLAVEEYWREQLLHELVNRMSGANMPANELQKRVPSGFTGLRGKRPADGNNNNNNINDNEDNNNSNAYEEHQHDTSDEDDIGSLLQAPNDAAAGRFADHLSVKRSPSESFSSWRNTGGGQRSLSDFNNKFVAVRGKKNPRVSSADIQAAANFLEQSAQLGRDGAGGGGGGGGAGLGFDYQPALQGERYLVGMLPSSMFYGSGGKRAPSGFMGMRGKRAVAESAGPAIADPLAAAGNSPVAIMVQLQHLEE